jgi:hypothetical protein
MVRIRRRRDEPRHRLTLVALLVLGCSAVPMVKPPLDPEAPRTWVDTEYTPPPGRRISVAAGGNVQAALDAARPGDVITLEAGATFEGPFRLPRKPGDGWIVVRTSVADDRLPPPGTRVDPAQTALMPKLVAASGAVVTATPGAHHYRFIGLEIRPAAGAFLHNLVQLGTTDIEADALPHHIVLDRCYLRGDPVKGTRRGVAMNARHVAVIDSYLADFKEVGADSQAIAGWAGPGPFKIVNNYLEGAGENVLFGGGDPFILNLVPSDIEIRRNHITKPLSWKVDDASYAGTPWAVKNLFELKNARRVLVEGNIFEHNWVHAQNGFAILFTVRNQDGRAPWSVVEDVQFTSNVVRHTAGGFNILGEDDLHPSQQTKRIRIENNLLVHVGDARWGGRGTLFQLLRGPQDVVIEHNTALQAGTLILVEGSPLRSFAYRHNIAFGGGYGVVGSGTAPGLPTLQRFFPGAFVEGNVIVGGDPSQYPPGTRHAGSLEAVGFVNPALGRYELAESSAYKRAGADGRDPGVDFERLQSALDGSRWRAAVPAPSAPAARDEQSQRGRRVAGEPAVLARGDPAMPRGGRVGEPAR